jgi:hypothetical protein
MGFVAETRNIIKYRILLLPGRGSLEVRAEYKLGEVFRVAKLGTIHFTLMPTI